ncbi:unnamed protein product, partial [Phaeothamnion confervicola]
TVGVQQVVAWLVENGADVNAGDATGQTALQAALTLGEEETAAALVRKGGETTASAAESPLSGHTDGKGLPDAPRRSSKAKHRRLPSDRNPLLPPPERHFGFTYASLLLEKISMASTDGVTTPFVTVSVYNAKGQLSEPPQDVCIPA